MKSIEPGHYPDQRMTEYHSSEGLSKTGLVKILDCPARFYAEYLDNERPASKEATPSLVLGSLTHNLVLEPERFAYEFTLAPQINRRTKAGKAEYEQWKKDNAGKTVISPEQHRQAQAMTNALAGHPIASRLLTGGQAEQSFYAIDPDYGLLVKARPDYMVEVNGQVIPVDLKTAQDAGPSGFAKACANYHYPLSAFLTRHVLSLLRIETGPYVFVVVETSYPYLVSTYTLDSDALELAESQYHQALAIYAQCQASGEWPGYSEQVTELSLPRWAFY